jgi:DNA-binding CsgD family transcriptional regulator
LFSRKLKICSECGLTRVRHSRTRLQALKPGLLVGGDGRDRYKESRVESLDRSWGIGAFYSAADKFLTAENRFDSRQKLTSGIKFKDPEAVRRGASGYLLKTCAADEMVIAVRKVLRGMSYLSPQLSKETVSYLRNQSKMLVEEQERLTDRQREVLQLLAEGKVMKEIGDILHMTTRTVAFHKYRMMEVLDPKSNAELVRYAVRNHSARSTRLPSLAICRRSTHACAGLRAPRCRIYFAHALLGFTAGS